MQLSRLKVIDKFPPLPSSKEVRQRIIELNRINLQQSDFELLKDRLNLLMHGISVSVLSFESGRTFYRGRVLEHPPTHIDEVGLPPVHLLTKYNRLNRPGKPILYTNLAAGSIFREIRAEPGQTVALACYRAKRPFHAVSAGFDLEAIQARGWNRKVDDWPANQQGALATDLNRIVNRFLAHQFLKDVPIGEEHLYKISAAWAEKIMGANAVDAVAYPSVANVAISDNVAFKPESLSDVLELIRVDFLRVNQMPDPHTAMTFLLSTESIGPSGSLTFRNPSGWNIYIHEQMNVEGSFQLEGHLWTMTAPNGDLIASESE